MAMEQKKTEGADLERYRLTWFLLGVIFILSTIYVAFNLTLEASRIIAKLDEEIDEVDLDLDKLNLKKDDEERIAVIQPKKKEVAQEIRVVDVVENEAQIQAPAASQQPTNTEKTTDEAEQKDAKILNEEQDPDKLVIAEQLPMFPGGLGEFSRWITKNLHYPQRAQQNRRQGKVVAQFIVERDGTISNLQLIKKCEANLDQEVLKVLNTMPKWEPGTDHGKPVRSMMCVPIVFSL